MAARWRNTRIIFWICKSFCSEILPLPTDVVNYLLENGTIVLPEDSEKNISQENDFNGDEDGEKTNWDETNAIAITGPKLTLFTELLNKTLRRFGGSVFPKLNWSAPRDANWMSLNNCLRCYSPADVYLLLKSSDFVTHDLTSPFKDCEDSCAADPVEYFLVLREWQEINPAEEFRVFVKNQQLIGICQRDTSQYYQSVVSSWKEIQMEIQTFWKTYIHTKFNLNSFVFDVYRPRNGEVVLVDFGPFGQTTDGLMFSWNELDSFKMTVKDESLQSDNDVEFRFITDVTGIQPSPFLQYGIPLDIRDLSMGEDAFKLIDFLQMKIGKKETESSDED